MPFEVSVCFGRHTSLVCSFVLTNIRPDESICVRIQKILDEDPRYSTVPWSALHWTTKLDETSTPQTLKWDKFPSLCTRGVECTPRTLFLCCLVSPGALPKKSELKEAVQVLKKFVEKNSAGFALHFKALPIEIADLFPEFDLDAFNENEHLHSKESFVREIRWPFFIRTDAGLNHEAIIYYIGHGAQQTGDWQLIDGSISLDDFHECGANNTQVPVTIISQCCFSGNWTNTQNTALDRLNGCNIRIVATCAKESTSTRLELSVWTAAQWSGRWNLSIKALSDVIKMVELPELPHYPVDCCQSVTSPAVKTIDITNDARLFVALERLLPETPVLIFFPGCNPLSLQDGRVTVEDTKLIDDNLVVQQGIYQFLLDCHPLSCGVICKETSKGPVIQVCVCDDDVNYAKFLPLSVNGIRVEGVLNPDSDFKPKILRDCFLSEDLLKHDEILSKNVSSLFEVDPQNIVGLVLGFHSSRGFTDYKMLCVKVVVHEKHNDKLSSERCIPSKVGDLQTDVVEFCDFMSPLMQCREDGMLPYRRMPLSPPVHNDTLQIGECIAVPRDEQPDLQGEYGTLCCFAQTRNTKQLGFITAAHVAKAEGRNFSIAQNHPNVAHEIGPPIGTCLTHIEQNSKQGIRAQSDYAFVKVQPNWQPDIRTIGDEEDWAHMKIPAITFSGAISENQPPNTRVFKFGATTHLTVGTVQQYHFHQQTGPRYLVQRFARWADFARPGDSGALVFNEQGNAVGLATFRLVDGSVVVMPMREVTERLQVNLLPQNLP